MYQVLVVDDSLDFLSTFEDALKSSAATFSCHFALGAKQALQFLESQKFDVILTDLEMPEMNGELLLQRISFECPATLRFIMTERAGSISPYRLFGVAQHVIAKDTPLVETFELIESAIALKEKIRSPDVLHCVQKFDSIPMLPDSFVKVSELLRKEDFHQRELIDAVNSDIALTAEVLRVANSAFFGARKKIINLDSALNILGTTSVRNIIIFAELFKQPKGLPRKLFDVASLWNHSVGVANMSLLLARRLGLAQEVKDAAFSAGLLHDLGKIVLAKTRPTDYAKVLELAENLEVPVHEAEIALFGASHDDVGAYLLETWGFPLSIVDAVAFHHHELKACCGKLSPLSIVAVANTIHHGLTAETEEPFKIEQFEETLLSEIDDDAIPLWKGLHRAFE